MIGNALDGARQMWSALAGVPVAFVAGEVSVVVAAESRWCPPGWSGIVTLGGATAATVPDARLVEPVRSALLASPFGGLESSTHLASLRDRLQVGGILGPTALAYLDAGAFTPVDDQVEWLPAGHPAVGALLEAAGSEDAGESGIAGITSPAFVLRDGDRVVAASGYTVWPSGVAHLGVLTDPGHRTRSLARRVASAASAHALENGLLPQWRARVEPSRRVAAALGYREFGLQLSVRLG